MKKERWLALFGAIALLVAGVWLSQEDTVNASKKEVSRLEKKEISFPRSEKAKTKIRQRRAATTNPLNQKQTQGLQKGTRALAQALNIPGHPSMFIDVQAVAQSPLLKKILDCRAQEASLPLKEIKEDFGIDLLKDVSRFGTAKGIGALTGSFRDLKVPAELGEGKLYGDTARIFKSTKDKQMFAKVGENLLLLADSEAELKAAIDRVEGEAPPADTTTKAALNEADVVANLNAKLLEKLLNGISPGISAQAKEFFEDGVMRLNVEDDVTASFDLKATSAQNGSDLSKALRGALAGLRTKATTDKNSHLAELLSQSHVEDFEDGTFAVDLAVPGPFLLNLLECDEPAQQAPTQMKIPE